MLPDHMVYCMKTFSTRLGALAHLVHVKRFVDRAQNWRVKVIHRTPMLILTAARWWQTNRHSSATDENRECKRSNRPPPFTTRERRPRGGFTALCVLAQQQNSFRRNWY
uniref:Uncharacterized protein n=1 Tax=Trichuris muris TaxID=70415 RepID=A0A5S6Q7P0_TRIMR